MSDTKKELRTAWQLIKSNQKREAGQIIQSILKNDPNNPDALFLASFVTSSTEKQISYLNAALRSDPEHARSKQRLTELTSSQATKVNVKKPSVAESSILTNTLGLRDS